jgi:hypothetical protein
MIPVELEVWRTDAMGALLNQLKILHSYRRQVIDEYREKLCGYRRLIQIILNTPISHLRLTI